MSPANAPSQVEPFRIAIPQARLDDLKQRLRATSWPGDFGNTDGRYGVEQGWLQDMASYWAEDFDWRAQEAAMNAFPQYRTTIDGVPIHFVHLRSGRPDAIPLILTHGWPWTFWDWGEIMKGVADAPDEGPAFDLVVPSLPGVAFSAPLGTTGLGVREIAALWVRLMRDVLGYDRFAAAGGDWGALITSELGHAHPQHLLAIHLTMVAFPEVNMLNVDPADFAPDEAWMTARMAEAAPTVGSHIAVQGSDPQTLAYAMADSPIGTAAWLWERRRNWSDCDGDVERAYSRDFLCATASLYWLTNTIGSSFRIYKEMFENGMTLLWPLLHRRLPAVPVPTGVAVAPRELIFMPRATAARMSDLRRWELMPRGGHFLPAETPAALLAEYRRFFGEVLPR